MSLFCLSTAELPLCLLLPEFNMSVAAVSSFALFIYLFIYPAAICQCAALITEQVCSLLSPAQSNV